MYKRFGWTNKELFEIGLGTWYGKNWILSSLIKRDIDKESRIKAIRRGLELGADIIDTAEIYQTEELVGKAIEGFKRESIFISSKVWLTNLSARRLNKALSKSLERLKTDYIDLYFIHYPNPLIDLKETAKALEKAVEENKIRYIGLSNFNLKEIKAFQSLLEKNKIAAIQLRYNLIDREVEKDILKYCIDNDIAFMAYYPLREGELTNDSRLLSIASKYNATPAQIALKWLSSKKNVFPIPRASNIKHVEENINASNIIIDKSDLEALDNLFVKR
ncbi:MAG: aldo/keto reductase [Candidatus Micrarchaeota archaeon]|nr:MAG: aldo/keto reductase [Candidatus Micrarchaeota archaeon]